MKRRLTDMGKGWLFLSPAIGQRFGVAGRSQIVDKDGSQGSGG